MPSLIHVSGPDEGKKIPLPLDRDLIFGRAENAHVVLTNKNASRQHARFTWAEGQPIIIDLGSSNGTQVNDLPISQITLMDGDTVKMGDEVFRFVEEGPPRRARDIGGLKLKPGAGKVHAVQPPDVTTQHLNVGKTEEQMDALYDTYMKLKSLYRVLQSMSAAESIDSLFRVAAESILLSMKCDRVAIVLKSEDDRLEPVHQAWSTELKDPELKKVIKEEDETINIEAIREVVNRKVPIFLFPEAEKGAPGLATGSDTLGAPIRRGESVVGVLYCDSPVTGRNLNKNDLDMVATIALQMGEPLGRLQQLERLKLQQSISAEFNRDGLTIITRSPVMKPVMQMVRQVAPTDSIALVLGESGTGKELLARAIHNLSPRRDRPFIAINCAALPENLIESELFGHEKGAFTGAFTRRPGKFEAANGGTIFLDEIGELPAPAQAKLLRVLQEGEIQRVGSVQNIKVDARVIAATNVALEQAVKEGRFREDLYYRINVVAIEVPPLRERFQDVQVLAQYYLEMFRKKIPSTARDISPEALQCMAQYHWPGNVRELRNVIERAMVLSRTPTILPADLPLEISQGFPAGKGITDSQAEEPTEDSHVCSLAEMEKRHVRTVLDIAGGNKQHAARLLGISRTTLYEKIKSYELET